MRFAFITIAALAAAVTAAPAVVERNAVDTHSFEARLNKLEAALDSREVAEAEDVQIDATLQAEIDKWEEVFADIENIPEEIVNDDEKATAYFNEHYAEAYKQVKAIGDQAAAQSLSARSELVARASVGACVWELINSIPVAKIFRLGQLIKKAGGVTALAQKLIKCRTRAVCQQVAGDIAVETFDLITNIPSVKEACIP